MSAVNQLNIQHSLRTHLQNRLGVSAIWVFDGVKLPDESARPFITVEQMQNNVTQRVKMREAVRQVYRFQIGLRAATISQRAQIQDAMEDIFNYDQIPLLDAGTGASAPAGYFNADLTAVVPMPADNAEAKSEYHRVYFDIEVNEIKYRN